MKSLKVILTAFALAALVAPTMRAAADAAPARERKQHNPAAAADARVNRIEQAVGTLTADQKTKIKAIVTANAEKAQSGSANDRKSLARTEREEIRAVLTSEQQGKFDAMPAGNGGKGRKKKAE